MNGVHRHAARAGVVLGAGSVASLVASSALAVGAPTPSTSPSTSPTQHSVVALELQTTGTAHLPDSPLTVIANLAPTAAYGAVALYDNGAEVASATHYRIRWSWSTTSMTVGTHHLLVRFTPTDASGYSPSKATATYVVVAPPVVRTKTPVSGGVSTPEPTHSARPTRSPAPRPTPTVKVTATPQAVPAGSLPFTGFDAEKLLELAAGLIASGASLIGIGRRKRS